MKKKEKMSGRRPGRREKGKKIRKNKEKKVTNAFSVLEDYKI